MAPGASTPCSNAASGSRCHSRLLDIAMAQTTGIAGCKWKLGSAQHNSHLRELGCSGGMQDRCRQAVASLKAPNSVFSFGGLGKQKDFLAAREALEAVKVPRTGMVLVG